MSIRGWARSRDIPHSTADKAVESGRLMRGPNGLDPAQADAEFAENTRLKVDGSAGIGNGRASRRALDDYRRVRAARERVRLERERLELQRARDGSVPAPAVLMMLRGVAQATAGPLRLLVARAAGRLVLQERPAVEAVLREETERTLADLGRLVDGFLQRYEPRAGGRRRKKTTEGT